MMCLPISRRGKLMTKVAGDNIISTEHKLPSPYGVIL